MKAAIEQLETSISPDEARRIREWLKRKEQVVGEERREHHRYDFEGDMWVVSLQEPMAAAPAAHAVYARNISRRGINFFHHGFVPPGTGCVLRFQAVDGRQREITGMTVRCTHVEDMIHEIGVRTTIDVDVGFLPPGGVYYPDETE